MVGAEATDEPRDEILRCYGEVMCVVQFWEQALCILWWSSTLPAAGSGELESKQSQKVIRRLEAALTSVTASKARKELGDDLPAAIADDTASLIAVRNRLAHRILRERDSHQSDGFLAGTKDLLLAAGSAFDNSVTLLMQELMTRPSYVGPVRDHWPDAAQAILDQLFRGEPIDDGPESPGE